MFEKIEMAPEEIDRRRQAYLETARKASELAASEPADLRQILIRLNPNCLGCPRLARPR